MQNTVLVNHPICTPALCTGCAACANVCPVSCITMQPDAEGFLRPQIDELRCAHCHLCEKRCHVKWTLLKISK